MTVEGLVRATRRFSREAGRLRFSAPVAQVYNPLDYARLPHEQYLRRYAGPARTAVFLGMNPGPFGMAQTGVPFGDAAMARGWLGIDARVGRPPRENPKRPVYGFACPRAEVSGRRFWGAIARLYGTPENFFSRFFVANYCPLAFMEAGGRNLTPDKLRRAEREALYAVCDEYLRRSLELFSPRWVVGIGRFAAGRAGEALAGGEARIAAVPHPSPASPAANRGWAGACSTTFPTYMMTIFLLKCLTRPRSCDIKR